MSYICQNCKVIMTQEISQLLFKYVCQFCKSEQMPKSCVIFSSKDQEQESVEISKIIGNPTIQRLNNKCQKCETFYYIYYQQGNQDVLYLCNCNIPKTQQIDKALFKPGLKSHTKNRSNKFQHYNLSKLR